MFTLCAQVRSLLGRWKHAIYRDLVSEGYSLYGEAPPERGTFFRVQVYKRVGISQVEVCKRVGKSVI